MPKGCWAPMGVVNTSTSQGCNVCIRSLFGALDTLLERYSRGVHIPFVLASTLGYMLGIFEPKKCRLGPQNGPRSLRSQKLVKNCQDGNYILS